MMRTPTNGAINRNYSSSGNGDGLLKVAIYNHSYTIRSEGDSEYLKALAEFVDRKMREISGSTSTVDSVKVAVLAALNIADELHRLKAQSEQADTQLANRSVQCSQMLDGLLRPLNPIDMSGTVQNLDGPAS